MVTSSSRPPVRTTASMAPLTSDSTMRPLKRPAIRASFMPRLESWPWISFAMSAPVTARDRQHPGARHLRQRDPLDHLDAEALDADDAAIGVAHQADLPAAEIRQHLGAEAEVAQRVALR